MALNSYAQLTANGTALNGDTSLSLIGGVDVSNDYIECFSVSWGSRLKDPASSGRARNRLQKKPVILLKPIDNTTPLLYQALVTNQRIDGNIKLFSTDSQTGETLHTFTLTLEQARVTSLESASASTLDTETAAHVPTERVEIAAQTITYKDEISGTEYQHS